MILAVINFVTRYIGLFRIAAIALAVMSYTGWVYQHGEAAARAQQAQVALRETKIHAQIEKKNETSTDKDLDRRLKKWMRD